MKNCVSSFSFSDTDSVLIRHHRVTSVLSCWWTWYWSCDVNTRVRVSPPHPISPSGCDYRKHTPCRVQRTGTVLYCTVLTVYFSHVKPSGLFNNSPSSAETLKCFLCASSLSTLKQHRPWQPAGGWETTKIIQEVFTSKILQLCSCSWTANVWWAGDCHLI